MLYHEGRRLRALELRTLFQTASASALHPQYVEMTAHLWRQETWSLLRTCLVVESSYLPVVASQSTMVGEVVVKVEVEPNASRRVHAVSRDQLLYCYSVSTSVPPVRCYSIKPLKAAISRDGDSDGIVRSEY